jgi:uncharacterized membrane protein
MLRCWRRRGGGPAWVGPATESEDDVLSRLAVVGLLAVALAGCDHMSRTEQRALSGGAIGAGGGAVLGAVAGFNPLLGAAVGGAAGAVVGAATSHRD